MFKETNQFKSTLLLLAVIIIGIFGNLLNIIVFSHKSMRKNATFKYLLYLSIIDLLVLLVCATDACLIQGAFIIIRSYSNLTCKLHTFLTYFLTHLSSIVLMEVNLERALNICHDSIAKINSFKNIAAIIKSIASLLENVSKAIPATLAIVFVFNTHFLMMLQTTKEETFSV